MLVEKDQISRQQYDQAVAAAEAARATVEAQKAAVVEAQHAISAARVAVEQARAKLAHADAEVETAMTGPQRAAYLSEACAGDRGLRREVESLLAASAADSGELAAPVRAAAGRLDWWRPRSR